MIFNLEELIEIKKALNGIIGQRIQYSITETNEKRLGENEKYKQLDYKLLEKFIKEIDSRKEAYEQLAESSHIKRNRSEIL